MNRKIRTALAALAIVAAVSASAATVSMAAATRAESVSVRVVSDTQGAVILVRGKLPKGERLPATVSLSVPSDARIAWAGEILGGDPGNDPEVRYERSKAEGYDVISMTLTQSREGQVEYRDSSVVKTEGQQTTADVKWISPIDAASGAILVEIPQGARVFDAGGAALDTSAGNFYRRQFRDVKAGDELSLKIVYAAAQGASTSPNANQGGTQAPPQPARTTTGSQAPASPTTLVLVALLLVGGTLFALRHVNSRQR